VGTRFGSLVARPSSEASIAEVAERLLRRAGVAGRVPTDVDALIASSQLVDVVDPAPFLEGFLARLSAEAKDVFTSAWEKLRGIADLRTRAIYVPASTKVRQTLFVKAHELGHQVLPWQQVNMAYWDDGHSLSPEVTELFDQEANLFAADVIFQGKRFLHRARQYVPTFDAVFSLADEHGASRHSTLWRFVEEQDELVAAATYWPSRYTFDREGLPVLWLGKLVGSPRFKARFGTLELPSELSPNHPWVAARNLGSVCEGDVTLVEVGGQTQFQWHSWWNQYSLFVMLRRKPRLSLVGRIIKP